MPGNGERRPADEPSGAMNPGEKFSTNIPRGMEAAPLFEIDRHGALIAADATMHLHRFAWDLAARFEVDAGREFTADSLQRDYRLPDLGNGTGGVLMALHRAGVIERVGYRPSQKPSRAGGVVSVWRGVGCSK